jgi:CubicO group peptidase (beta-lactamase class C family)
MVKRHLLGVASSVTLFFFVSHSAAAQVTTLNGRVVTPAAFEGFLQKEMDSLGIPGVSIAVINHGRIVYQGALGIANTDTKKRVDDQSIFEAASMSKPVFAYLVMRMVDKGLIDLDVPLYRYMPYADIERDERYKLITARMVLTHRTGFPNWRYFNRADTSLHVHFPDLYLKFTPGTRYSYSGEGFLYLAKVVAHLAGRDLQTLEQVFEQEVAIPLGMKHAWFTGNAFISQHKVAGHVNGKVAVYHNMNWPISFPTWDSTYFNPAASLHTDAESYANFLIGLMNGVGLRKGTLTEMLKPQASLPDSIAERKDERAAVGLGIFMEMTPYGTVYEHGGDNGNFKSHFVWYKSQKAGYVFFANSDKGDELNTRLREFFTNGM